MEKRLFLAVGLSIMVVWIWSALTPAPQSVTPSLSPSQTYENKSVVDVIDTLERPATPPASPESAIVDLEKSNQVQKRIEKLESDELIVEFSNIGASIEKVTIKEFNEHLLIKDITSIQGYENAPFILEQVHDNEIIYTYNTNDFKLTKTYKINDGEDVIRSNVKVYNKSELSKLTHFEFGGYTIDMSNLNDKNSELSKEIGHDKSLFEYAIYAGDDIHRKANAHKFSEKESEVKGGKVHWVGFRTRYFCALISPLYETKGYSIDYVDDNTLKIKVKTNEVKILPKNSVDFNSVVYIGPEKLSTLKEFGLSFEKIRRYYRFGLFDGVAKIIAGAMHALHNVIPNWGVCIILISIVIYFSMYPLTLKGMLSMKKMQSLQPMIVKLKEKHKDNPQKMNKEMMELYKEHKVNPLGGCLPMLLQMPVFIGLYQVLWRSVSLKGQKFLWINDLTQPDRLFIMPFKLPFIGNEFNLLPLIMVVVMFFQQKLSSKNMVITDSSQAAQQKMMTTIMPVFLGFIFYKFASGLTLYFTMFYFFSTFTQWKMSKTNKGA